MQACVATVCGLALEDVPHFVTFENWMDEYFQFWLGRGIVVTTILPPSIEAVGVLMKHFDYSGLCIVCVESFAHEGKLHAVVGVIVDGRVEIVHDPHPANENRAPNEYGITQIDLFFDKK